MTSRTTERFRKAFQNLPLHVQLQARKAYRLWKQDPWNKSLRFKLIHTTKPIYSVRIGIDYRAVGVRNGDEMVWFWIGSHADYDNLIKRL